MSSIIPTVSPNTSDEFWTTNVIIYVVCGGVGGILLILVSIIILKILISKCYNKHRSHDAISLTHIYDKVVKGTNVAHAQEETDRDSLRIASNSISRDKSFKYISKRTVHDSSDKVQKNPSFSKNVKEMARNRFPDGTVDWFLSSDFNIDSTAVKLLDILAKGSFGTVYKAIYQGEIRAVKLEDIADNTGTFEEQVHLLVELTMLQSYPHERLVKFIGATCIASEHCGIVEKKVINR